MNNKKQNQELEYIGNGYYKIDINKQNLVSAYKSTLSRFNEGEE